MTDTPFTDALRAAVEAAVASGTTEYAIAKRAGVAQIQLSRWRSGERRGMTLDTADRLAVALGITAIPEKKRDSGKSGKKR